MPALLALLASVLFGAAMIVTRFGLRHMDPVAGALVSIPTTAALFWSLAPLQLGGVEPVAEAIGVFAVVGLFFPALVTLLVFESNRSIGPTPTATISATAPLFAIGGATLLLGEHLSLAHALGIGTVVGGVMLLSRGGNDQPSRWRTGALWLPLGASAIRGFAQLFTKVGLTLLPSPYVAALVGYTTSALTILAVAGMRWRQGRLVLRRQGLLWFVLGGLCNGSAVLALYAALNQGQVSLVAPIVATFPLFTLLFSVVFLRQETLRTPALAGVGLIVVGVVQIVW